MNNYRERPSLDERKLNIDVKGEDILSASIVPSIVFAFISALCSLALPASLTVSIYPEATVRSGIAELLSFIICMVCATCIVVCAKRFFIMLVAAVLASFVISFSGSTLPVALVLGTLCSIAFGSAAISRKKSNAVLITLLIAVLSFFPSWLLTRDAVCALSSLLALPTTLTLGIANRKKTSKTAATVAGTVTFVATTLSILLTVITLQYGSLTVDTVKIAARDFGYTIEYMLETSILSAGNRITPEIGMSISELADTSVNSLPGVIVAWGFFVAYICQSMSLAVSERLGEDIRRRNFMSADVVSALLFIVTYITSFATSASGGISFAAVVASNIAMMLTPCLFIIGLRSLKLMPFRLGLIGLILTGAVIVIIFLPSSSALTVLALTGALYTVVVSVDAWAKDHYSKGDNI